MNDSIWVVFGEGNAEVVFTVDDANYHRSEGRNVVEYKPVNRFNQNVFLDSFTPYSD